MRKVLLVSYYTPPRPGVATSRTRQLRRYLPEFGWDVTTVTARLDGAADDVIQTDYLDVSQALKKAVGLGSRSAHETLTTAPAPRGTRRSLRQNLIMWGFRLTSYPDPQVGWFSGGRRTLRSMLATGGYDAIISTSPPFTTNLMIASLQPAIPWIADFRDLWAERDLRDSRLVKLFDGALERWTLGSVSALTTVSEPLARVLRNHGPGLPVEVIPNAFDAAEWNGVPFASESRCTIVHAGPMYHGRRDPRPILRALRSLLDERSIVADEVRVDLYAPPEQWLTDLIAEYGLGEVVRLRGTVSREEVMAAERRADRLVVILWDGPNTEGILTGKIFEYLGARRRIVAVGGPARSVVDDLLAATGAGVRCTDDQVLKRELLDAVDEHRRGAVRITESERLQPYEASTIAASFGQLLDSIAAVKSPVA
ncbi:MAG TPA: glycosyltransferase [Candidatus Baltobacteraceae bacterium]|jgi:glycosyltransferase involved in cell wall biosynthesis|nr:glycosyltransferase [Candidatus Baltobacteraceae bacterium]